MNKLKHWPNLQKRYTAKTGDKMMIIKTEEIPTSVNFQIQTEMRLMGGSIS